MWADDLKKSMDTAARIRDKIILQSKVNQGKTKIETKPKVRSLSRKEAVIPPPNRANKKFRKVNNFLICEDVKKVARVCMMNRAN